jgi:hypothetical protein
VVSLHVSGMNSRRVICTVYHNQERKSANFLPLKLARSFIIEYDS